MNEPKGGCQEKVVEIDALPGHPDGSWDAEVVRDLMFSLAWASWSAYHTRNAVEILRRHCPDLDAVEQVKKFSAIIDAPRGPGSPK